MVEKAALGFLTHEFGVDVHPIVVGRFQSFTGCGPSDLVETFELAIVAPDQLQSSLGRGCFDLFRSQIHRTQSCLCFVGNVS